MPVQRVHTVDAIEEHAMVVEHMVAGALDAALVSTDGRRQSMRAARGQAFARTRRCTHWGILMPISRCESMVGFSWCAARALARRLLRHRAAVREVTRRVDEVVRHIGQAHRHDIAAK